MEKYSFNELSQIYLFRSKPAHSLAGSCLNEFLSYLKFYRVMGPYKFSFVGKNGNLIPELTLKQNLLIDYTSESLTEEKEAHFRENLKTKPNLQLEALYNHISNLNDLPKNSTPEEIKLVSLLKALLSDAPYLFLENPEADLSENTFKIFQEALFNQIRLTEQNVFIITKRERSWSKYVTKIVGRNKDFTFKTENSDPILDFTVEKLKFYKLNQEEMANQPSIKFQFPMKKSA